MKKLLFLSLVLILIISICACSVVHDQSPANNSVPEPANGELSASPEDDDFSFIQTEKGTITSVSGVEYKLIGTEERNLHYLGELEFAGSVKGEEKTLQHMGVSFQTGMFSIKNSINDNVLIRYVPYSEWYLVYRKSELPDLDYSVENCTRLEFVPGSGYSEDDSHHTSCNGGITDTDRIAEFLDDVRSQRDPNDAGLYDAIINDDGFYENCYQYGNIYGFFEEEPNLVIRMRITSFNDTAYSITFEDDEYAIEDMEYVLPELWLNEFLDSSCTP